MRHRAGGTQAHLNGGGLGCRIHKTKRKGGDTLRRNWNHSHLRSQPWFTAVGAFRTLLSRALCADLPGGCGLLELSGAPVHRSQGSRRLPDRLTTVRAHFFDWQVAVGTLRRWPPQAGLSVRFLGTVTPQRSLRMVRSPRSCSQHAHAALSALAAARAALCGHPPSQAAELCLRSRWLQRT